MSSDWLALEAPVDVQTETPRRYTDRRREELGLTKPTYRSLAKQLGLKRDTRSVTLAKYKKAMRPDRLECLRLAEDHLFNRARVVSAMQIGRPTFTRRVLNRWLNTDRVFAAAWKLALELKRDEVVQPVALLVRAHEIGEDAMEPQPVFNKDGDIVGHEKQLDTALRANEQQMKALKMIGGDAVQARVTVKFVNLAGMDGPGMEADASVIEGEAEAVE